MAQISASGVIFPAGKSYRDRSLVLNLSKHAVSRREVQAHHALHLAGFLTQPLFLDGENQIDYLRPMGDLYFYSMFVIAMTSAFYLIARGIAAVVAEKIEKNRHAK